MVSNDCSLAVPDNVKSLPVFVRIFILNKEELAGELNRIDRELNKTRSRIDFLGMVHLTPFTNNRKMLQELVRQEDILEKYLGLLNQKKRILRITERYKFPCKSAESTQNRDCQKAAAEGNNNKAYTNCYPQFKGAKYGRCVPSHEIPRGGGRKSRRQKRRRQRSKKRSV